MISQKIAVAMERSVAYNSQKWATRWRYYSEWVSHPIFFKSFERRLEY